MTEDQKYQHLEGCIAGFTAEHFEMDREEYKTFFQENIQYGYKDKEAIAREFDLAIRDGDFSFKAAAKLSHAFFFAEEKTEEEIRLDLQLLTWDVLFPERVLATDQLLTLQSAITEAVRHQELSESVKWVSMEDTLRLLHIIPQWEQIQKFDIIYMFETLQPQNLQLDHYDSGLWFVGRKKDNEGYA